MARSSTHSSETNCDKLTLSRIRKKCSCMHAVLLHCVGGVVGKCVSENRWEK